MLVQWCRGESFNSKEFSPRVRFSEETHVVHCSVRLQKTRELSSELFSNDDLQNFCGTLYSGRKRWTGRKVQFYGIGRRSVKNCRIFEKTKSQSSTGNQFSRDLISFCSITIPQREWVSLGWGSENHQTMCFVFWHQGSNAFYFTAWCESRGKATSTKKILWCDSSVSGHQHFNIGRDYGHQGNTGDLDQGRGILSTLWLSVRCWQRLDHLVEGVSLVVSWQGGHKCSLQRLWALSTSWYPGRMNLWKCGQTWESIW